MKKTEPDPGGDRHPAELMKDMEAERIQGGGLLCAHP
jgi:hypothetical protein